MERCFNATDDNCNGVIDEGCGIKTGPVQFEIGWGDSDADVDLSVVGPGGERVDRANRTTPTHLRFERDCPAEDCFGQNYENVYLDGVEPAGGAYVVEVKLRRAEGKTLPIGGRLGVRLGRRTLGVEFVLIEPGEQKVFSFVL
jgi:tRNA (guanosine-2'-O-)-methyltransferase